MTDSEIIRYMDDGVYFYLDFFADAKHMERIDTGFYRYMRPLPGEQGISFVYYIRLEQLPKGQQLEKIAEIKRFGTHTWWPLLTSDELYRLIHGRDREQAPLDPPDGEELYMAVTSEGQIPDVPLPGDTAIQRVRNEETFAVWAGAVNDWLHGGNQYVHPQNHYSDCATGKIRCYICYKDKHPVSVCSIMDNGGICSLEFVATHPDFRRQGFAKSTCAFAMKAAFHDGANIITLRADNPGTRELYTSLGFKIYNYAI